MQYWMFVLNKESQDLCTIVTPFDTYRYCQGPMGLANTPAFAQAQMEKVLAGIEDQDAYSNNVEAFSVTKNGKTAWVNHLELLDKIFTRLKKKLHSQSRKMRMGSQGDLFPRLLADSHWHQAMGEEG